MTSIHCAPLLAAILLLIPAVHAQSAPTTATGQTILDQTLSADVALPVLGGQLTNGFPIAFAVATDKYPNTVNTGAVSFGFQMANALAVNGQITLTLPKGYFTNVDSSKVNTFTGASATTCKCILTAGTAAATTDVMTCTIAGAALAAGAVTLSMAVGAVTTGAPTEAKTYNVQTSVDRALAAAPATQMIGGVIGSVIAPAYSTATAAADKVPFTVSTGTCAIGFTVVTPVPIGGRISVSFPKSYLSAVSSTAVNTFAGKTTATNCVLNAATGTATVDTVVCTTTTEVLAATAQLLTFVAGSLTTGGPVDVVTGGIKVATSTDRESLAGVDTVALGSVFAAYPTYTAATANAASIANTVAIAIGFTPVTPVPVGGKITIAFPRYHLSSVDSTFTIPFTTGATTATAKCVLTPFAGTAGTAVLGVTDADTVVCTTSGAILTAIPQVLSFSPSSVIMGGPQIAGKINIATSTDRIKTGGTHADSTQVLGSVFAAHPTAITGTHTPGVATTAAIAVTFTFVTAIPVGGRITIALPSKYVTAVDASATFTVDTATAKCVLTAVGTAIFDYTSADTIVCTTAGAIVALGAKIFTFPIGSITMGVPQAAGVYNIATSTDRFLLGSTAAAVKLGGAIAATTPVLTIAVADRVPFQLNTAAITIAFTTDTVTLPSGGKITISLPRNYVTKVDASKVNVITSTTSATCALTPATGVDVADTIICTTSGDAVSIGAGTLVFPIGTITTGGAVAAGTGAFSFGTSMHVPAVGNTLQLGGANVAVPTAGVALTFTNADDRVPGKFTSNNNTITLGFKTSASSTSVSGGLLSIGSTITLTFPQNYFSKVDATKDNTVGSAATAKCALASATSSLPAAIALDKTTVSTSGATLTVSFMPATVTGVTQLAIPFAGFALDTASAAQCTANCQNSGTAGKVTAALASGVLTFTLAADGIMLLKNKLTTFTVTLVTTPSVAWATTGITATSFNPSTTVVCTTAGAAIAVNTEVAFTFVAGSVTIGSGQKVSTFQIETSSDLPMASAAATLALGGGLSAGRALAFANAQDAIPGKVNTGAVSLGANLATSVPIGGQFLLTFPSNYFTAVNPASVVTLTKGTRRSLLQTSTLSCVRTAGATVDQITCTLAGAASGTGAVVITFPAGSLTTGLPTAPTGGFNLATANPPAAGAARVPYFPKAAGSAYGVAWLLVALSALLACF